MSAQDSHVKSLELLPVEEQDCAVIAEFAIDELDNDPITKAALCKLSTAEIKSLIATQMVEVLRSDRAARFIKLEDRCGVGIIGYARWQIPTIDTRNPTTPATDHASASLGACGKESRPDRVNLDLVERFAGNVQAMRRRHADPETTYGTVFVPKHARLQTGSRLWVEAALTRELVLSLLAVRSNYRLQGAAKKLVGWGLQRADRDGANAYAEATTTMLGFCEKFGWCAVDEICVDLGHFVEGGKVQRTTCMLRRPRNPSL